MKWESSSLEQETEGTTEEVSETRGRRLLRLSATVAASAIAGMLVFGGTQGTSDQPHDPNKNGVSPGKFPHPDALEQQGQPPAPDSVDQQILDGPTDFDSLQLYL